MASVIDEKVIAPRRSGMSEGARRRVEDYLKAWRLPPAWQEELLSETMTALEARAGEDDPIRLAVQEAEKLVHLRLKESLKLQNDCAISDECLAMLCAGLPTKWSDSNE